MSYEPAEATQQPSIGAVETLHQNIGRIKTVALRALDEKLPWYRELPAGQRAQLGQVASQGLNSFASWFANPSRTGRLHMHQVVANVFGDTPSELSRTVSLRQASQLLRTMLEAIETSLPSVMNEQDKASTREAVLWYSREIAFALADVYARAAETRGSWDTRLESLLLDAVLRGDDQDEIRSRSAAFGWKSTHGIIVAAGFSPSDDKPGLLASLRQKARRARLEALIGVFSDQLVIVFGGVTDISEFESQIQGFFAAAPSPIVYGQSVGSLLEAHKSAHAATVGLVAARSWPNAPHPVAAHELLPERVLNGDASARKTLTTDVYQPLVNAGNQLLETVDVYIQLGQSLEATAREMFIHVNTVRYRLRRVTQTTGLDPTLARDAYVLQIALSLGRLEGSRDPHES